MADERPGSWAEARTQVDAASAEPSTGGTETATATVSEPAGSSPASVSPPETADPSAAAPTTPPTAQGTPGEPPQERWPTILDNARKKAREEAAAEFSQRFGWVPQTVTPEVGQRMLAIHQQMASDPVGFATQFLSELQQHPEYSQQLRSQAARMLASGRQPPPDAEPPPDVDLGEGAPKLRSAENQAQWAAWFQRQLLGQVKQEFAPIVQSHEQRVKAEQEAAQLREVQGNAKALFDRAEKLPHFKDHQKAIAEKYAARVQEGFPDHLSGQVLYECYTDVLTTQVLPTLDARSRSAALHAMNAKANGTTQNPASPSPQSTGRPKSWAEARRQQGLT